MASTLRRFFQSPLRITLICHFLSAAVTGGLVIGAVLANKGDPNGSGWLVWLGGQLQAVSTGAGGMTLLYLITIPLAALLVTSLVLGLVYGRWGLPGYLQGRAVFFVPILGAVYFLGGALALESVSTGSFGQGWSGLTHLVTSSPGLTLVLIYACLATSAVGLGWAAALAVTQVKRRRGKWETIGYVEQKA